VDASVVADASVAPVADRSDALAAKDRDCLSALGRDCPLALGAAVDPGVAAQRVQRPQVARLPADLVVVVAEASKELHLFAPEQSGAVVARAAVPQAWLQPVVALEQRPA
jgi:hypothetical protein